MHRRETRETDWSIRKAALGLAPAVALHAPRRAVSPIRLGRSVLSLRTPSQIRGVYPSWRNLLIALYWARIRGIEAKHCERCGGTDAYHGSYWAGEREDWHRVWVAPGLCCASDASTKLARVSRCPNDLRQPPMKIRMIEHNGAKRDMVEPALTSALAVARRDLSSVRR